MESVTRQWTKGGGASVGQLKQILAYGDGSVIPLPDLESAVYQIRKVSPGGVDTILIGLSPTQGMKIVKTGPATLNVLIGLLLPAVEKITDGTSNTIALLDRALRPGGSIGFVMADGSVTPADQRYYDIKFTDVTVGK